VPSEIFNTMIGKDTILNGIINGRGSIQIDGEAEGIITCQGDVVVGESGRAAVEMKARNITIAGHYQGTLEASGKLEIKRTGTAIGTFQANALVAEEGAVFSGKTEMKENEQASESLKNSEKSSVPLQSGFQAKNK
jgi:cytoskeletal protein CcmA (bactofilin family)